MKRCPYSSTIILSIECIQHNIIDRVCQNKSRVHRMDMFFFFFYYYYWNVQIFCVVVVSWFVAVSLRRAPSAFINEQIYTQTIKPRVLCKHMPAMRSSFTFVETFSWLPNAKRLRFEKEKKKQQQQLQYKYNALQPQILFIHSVSILAVLAMHVLVFGYMLAFFFSFSLFIHRTEFENVPAEVFVVYVWSVRFRCGVPITYLPVPSPRSINYIFRIPWKLALAGTLLNIFMVLKG